MIPCASVSAKRARISVVEAYGTPDIFAQPCRGRRCPGLGDGPANGLLVEHALAGGADLSLDLVRHTATLPDRAKSDARVLVRLGSGLLHCHLRLKVGRSSDDYDAQKGHWSPVGDGFL